MSVVDRAALEDSPLADLHALASELGIDGFRRLRKAELVDKILVHQGGEEGTTDEDADGEEKPKRTRTRRPRAKKDADDKPEKPETPAKAASADNPAKVEPSAPAAKDEA